MVYLTKTREEILRQALQKLTATTPITSVGAGSVARALAEAVVNEIGDLYSILQFNVTMGVISTAQGRALELIGQLYGVNRKTLNALTASNQTIGSFYFYLDSPHNADITIPEGTRVFTESTGFIGDEMTYRTVQAGLIPAGRTRVYVGLVPEFTEPVFTAGVNTLIKHNFEAPVGVTIRATNPKVIPGVAGYESDDNYRNRIIKAVRTAAGGTLEAVRFAGLSIPGVRDIRIRQAPYGLGSFEAVIVPEDRTNIASTVVRVADAMDQVRPVGVRMFAREPDYLGVEIHATIIVRKDIDVEPSGIARRVEIAVLRYLNTLLPGSSLVYAQLIQAMMDASDALQDVAITRFRIAGSDILRRNYTPKEEQQLVPGEIRILAS